jgi:hypothetical protein
MPPGEAWMRCKVCCWRACARARTAALSIDAIARAHLQFGQRDPRGRRARVVPLGDDGEVAPRLCNLDLDLPPPVLGHVGLGQERFERRKLAAKTLEVRRRGAAGHGCERRPGQWASRRRPTVASLARSSRSTVDRSGRWHPIGGIGRPLGGGSVPRLRRRRRYMGIGLTRRRRGGLAMVVFAGRSKRGGRRVTGGAALAFRGDRPVRGVP